jgi:hypothetical protein
MVMVAACAGAANSKAISIPNPYIYAAFALLVELL